MAVGPVAGEYLWILASGCQNGGRFLPGISFVLERRRVLSLLSAAGFETERGNNIAARRPDICAVALFLSDAAWYVEPRDLRVGGALGGVADCDFDVPRWYAHAMVEGLDGVSSRVSRAIVGARIAEKSQVK